MSTLQKIICFSIIVGSTAHMPSTFAANSTNDEVFQTPVNPGFGIQNVQKFEALWPQAPDNYFESAVGAAKSLSQSTNIEAHQVLATLWTNIMQKPLPIDDQQATASLKLKHDFICVYMNDDRFSDDKTKWLDVARFLGEIRSRIIPHYTNRGMLISAVASTPEEQQKLKVQMDENKKNIATDNLQQDLRIVDWQLSSRLIRNPSKDIRQDPKFIEAVIGSAHLKPDEVKRIKNLK